MVRLRVRECLQPFEGLVRQRCGRDRYRNYFTDGGKRSFRLYMEYVHEEPGSYAGNATRRIQDLLPAAGQEQNGNRTAAVRQSGPILGRVAATTRTCGQSRSAEWSSSCPPCLPTEPASRFQEALPAEVLRWPGFFPACQTLVPDPPE